MNNALIIIFGATGDLTRRKLIPALYTMLIKGNLQNVRIIGVARDIMNPHEILGRAREFIPKLDEQRWAELEHKFSFHPLHFDRAEDFDSLRSVVESLEKHHNLSGNRLIYLAAAAYYFCELTTHIGQARIAERISVEDKKRWHRIVYEKPFGHDLASAYSINACIKDWFDESQIYRIDHYLTKELVANISLMRFMNCVFQPIWDNRYIDQMQIILSEKIGLEGRGAFYDSYGALRDVVQNHMLELLALMTMESPPLLIGDYVRTQRARILEKVQVVDAILGQYEGYTAETGVAPDSKTETYAAVMLRIAHPRWAGVPFYLKTGKKLAHNEMVIHVKFKQVDCLLAKQCPSESNWLTIKVSPDARFSLTLNVKKPGETQEMVPIALDFCHSCVFGDFTPNAYQVLLEEIMRGDTSVSVRFDEIESLWKIVDEIRARSFPLFSYKQESNGPLQDSIFERKHGFKWRL